ncbi:unnamed protein product [marine sediment metagenome]|uniref:Uncharacterized protein n=1 Tax=marine sediment metagenome TaxID=412755 RepID=X0W593_9ZZZZ
MTPKFLGYVDADNKLILPPDEAARYMRHLKKLSGVKVWHTVEEQEPTRSDPLRKYYFKWVMGPVRDHTGASVEAIHDEMKRRYAATIDKFGITHVESVWSNKSTMKIMDKKAFLLNVRNWAWDFLEVETPEFEPKNVG